MLYHDRAIAAQRRARAERVLAVNLGFNGGKAASDVLKALEE